MRFYWKNILLLTPIINRLAQAVILSQFQTQGILVSFSGEISFRLRGVLIQAQGRLVSNSGEISFKLRGD